MKVNNDKYNYQGFESLQPNVVDLRYLKLWILLDKIIQFNISEFTASGCEI